MEYACDFLKLCEEQDNIAWALSRSEPRIRSRHYAIKMSIDLIESVNNTYSIAF
jgi:hypothetical protein